MDKILHYLKDPKLWNYGIFLIMGNAGFCPSTVWAQGSEGALELRFRRDVNLGLHSATRSGIVAAFLR